MRINCHLKQDAVDSSLGLPVLERDLHGIVEHIIVGRNLLDG